MRPEKWRFNNVLFSCLMLLFLLSGGCAPPANNVRNVPVEDARNKGRLSLFLDLFEAEGPDLSMQIVSVQLQPEQGPLVTHVVEPVVLQSGTMKAKQKFLARLAVEPGKYTQVRLVIGEAGTVSDGNVRLLPLKATDAVMELRTPLEIGVGDSMSFFFTWDTRKSLQENQFYPSITVAPRLKKLLADVLYVACPQIDTVFMINTEKNHVIDSLGIPGGPIYVLRGAGGQEGEVLVLTEKRPRLYAFSPSSNRVSERYDLSRVFMPVHIARSPDGEWAYVLDKQNGTVSRIDMNSGAIENQAQLHYKPMYILYLEKYNKLAVSLDISEEVVLLDPVTLDQAGTISTGIGPDGMELVDEQFLYIAESGRNSILIYDLDAGRMISRIAVGAQPRRVFKTNNFIYIANAGGKSLSTMRPGQLTTGWGISLTGKPLEMAYTEKNGWLYIGNERAMSLDVIDTLTNEVVGSIELGAVPMGMVPQH